MIRTPALKDMTRVLGMAERTARYYRKQVFEKFGVSQVEDLVCYLLWLVPAYFIHKVVGEHPKFASDRRYHFKTAAQRQSDRSAYLQRWYVANKDKKKQQSRAWREAKRAAKHPILPQVPITERFEEQLQ